MKLLADTIHLEPIEGVFTYQSKKVIDNRGVFQKYYDASMTSYIKTPPAECYVSTSVSNVVRGLHFQRAPFEQYKIVTCLSGAFIDVAVDLRDGSPTFGEFNITEVNSENGICIFIPPMFAHGILTTEENTVMLSLSSTGYFPDYEDGIRIDSIGLPLDLKDFFFTPKDRQLPTLDEYIKNTFQA
jgi:dTDP-4-dehydrorhamnose 3,5-epimerase